MRCPSFCGGPCGVYSQFNSIQLNSVDTGDVRQCRIKVPGYSFYSGLLGGFRAEDCIFDAKWPNLAVLTITFIWPGMEMARQDRRRLCASTRSLPLGEMTQQHFEVHFFCLGRRSSIELERLIS